MRQNFISLRTIQLVRQLLVQKCTLHIYFASTLLWSDKITFPENVKVRILVCKISVRIKKSKVWSNNRYVHKKAYHISKRSFAIL
jgi:hypothetical protein